jgi:hypothetical protein
MDGDEVTALIDSDIVAVLHDSSHFHGQAGLGCGWRGTSFSHFLVQPDERAAH